MLPLQVVLTTATKKVHVTADLLGGLRFSSTVPGGYATCTFTVPRSLRLLPEQFEPFTRVDIVDTRTAETVWSGRLDVPGRQLGGDGETFDITATGAQSHATDVTAPVVYVDRRYGMWERAEEQAYTGGEYRDNTDASATGVPAARQMFLFPRNSYIAQDYRVVARYYPLLQTGQNLAYLSTKMTGGYAEPALLMQLVGRGGGVAGASGDSVLAQTAITTSEQTLSNAPSGAFYLPEMRLLWNSAVAGAVGTDTAYALLRDTQVQGQRLNADGTAVTSYSSTLTTADVVADVLGRFLPDFTGTVAASAFELTQLAYEDGTTARQILEDLMQFDPAYFWAAWEYDDDGKARFEWSQYPTDVTLDLDVADGFDSPGGAADLYNEVAVRWVDADGNAKTTTRTASSAILTSAGLTRRAQLDLGSQAGSSGQAVEAGDNFLAEHALPRNNGTLAVSEPIADRALYRTLQPWEIRPGGLVRVRNVAPRLDSLNPSGRDAVTIFRVAQTDYDSGSNTCTLTLDSDEFDTARALARLQIAVDRQPRQ